MCSASKTSLMIILTTDYSPWSEYSGGGQSATHNIAMALCKRGHDVTVIFTKPPWETILTPPDLPYQLEWAPLWSPKSKRQALLRPFTAVSVLRKVKEVTHSSQRFIVHSNGQEGGLLHRLKKHRDVRLVATPHFPHYPKPFLNYRRLSFAGKAAFALSDAKFLMQAKAVLAADIVSPPSHWAGNIAMEALNISPSKVKPVHNGVPVEALRFRRPADQKGPIVFFGRFSRSKGIDTLLDACCLLDGDTLPAIELIGRGELEENIRRRVNENGLHDKISIKPWMTQEQIACHLSKSGMAVLPSREENFSLAVLLSMCVGIPTITTNVGGTAEVVRDKENALLLPPDNPNLLAEAIRYLLEHPQEASAMGQKASALIRNEFTWEAAALKFENLYRQALAS